MVAVIEPGTGRVRALAVNRQLQDRRPEEPAEQALQRPEEGQEEDPGQLPEHGQPAAHRRRRHLRLPGRLDLQDVHAWWPRWRRASRSLQDQRAAAVQVGLHHRAAAARPPARARTSTARRTPATRPAVHNMWSGFGQSVNTYFVPLEQQVGAENVVKAAKRLGIKFRAADDATLAATKDAATSGAPSPWASPPPPRWTWPTRTPPWPPTASTASPSRCRRSRDPERQQARHRQPALRAAVQHRRGPRRRGRGPLPGR